MLKKLFLLTCLFPFYTISYATTSEIRIAWESQPRSLDPRFSTDANSQYLNELLFCQLITFNENGEIQNDLAKSLNWKSPTQLEVKIHPHVTFGKENKLTSSDVAATYQYFLNKNLKFPSPRQSAFLNIKSINIVSEDTLEFQLKEPDAAFTTNLVIGILPKLYVKDNILEADTLPKGCGPFELVSQNSHNIELKKNPHYKLGAIPKLEKVHIKIVQDETTRFAKIQAREVDLVQNLLSREKLSQFQRSQDFVLTKKPGLRTTYLGFNMKHRILKTPAVRQAIDHAINRDAIIQHILKGYATPAESMMLDSSPFTNPNLTKPEYNPRQAKQLVQSVTNKPISLTLTTTTDRTRVLIAKAIQQDLNKIGIRLKVQSLEWGRFKQAVEKGHVELWMLEWIGFKDPDIFRYAFNSDFTPPNGGNRGWYQNAEVDKLSTLGQTTTNLKSRTGIYHRIQTILDKEKPYVFLWHEDMVAVHPQKLKGFKLYTDGRLKSLVHAHWQ